MNLINEFWNYLAGCKKLYTALFAPLREEYSLTQIEVDVLLFLRNNPTHNTARDIVQLRWLAKSNVSTALEDLRRGGYLSLREDPENRRVKSILLKESGRSLAETLSARQQELFSLMLEGVPEDTAEVLRSFFQQTGQNIAQALTRLKKEKTKEEDSHA